MSPAYNAIHLSGIVHQKGGLDFFDVLVGRACSSHKHILKRQKSYNAK